VSKEYNKGREVVMFSNARIAFEKEIRDNHPKLAMKILIAQKEAGYVPGQDEFDEGLAIGTVAAEFNIIMEGDYSREQIEFQYNNLWQKLRGSAAPIADIILPPGSTLQ
jgi:hypothetical protein